MVEFLTESMLMDLGSHQISMMSFAIDHLLNNNYCNCYCCRRAENWPKLRMASKFQLKLMLNSSRLFSFFSKISNYFTVCLLNQEKSISTPTFVQIQIENTNKKLFFPNKRNEETSN